MNAGSPLDVQGRHHLKSRAQVPERTLARVCREAGATVLQRNVAGHEHCSGSNRSPCNRSARVTNVAVLEVARAQKATKYAELLHGDRCRLVVAVSLVSLKGNFRVTKSNRNHLPTFHRKRDKIRTPRDKIKNRYSGLEKTASGQIRNVFSVFNVCYCNCFVFCRVFFQIDHVLLVARAASPWRVLSSTASWPAASTWKTDVRHGRGDRRPVV